MSTKDIHAVIRLYETGDAKVTVTEDGEALPEQWYYEGEGGWNKAIESTKQYIPEDSISIYRV